MSPDTRAAVRTRARAEVRLEVALMQYRRARSYWLEARGKPWPYDYRQSRYLNAITARQRWSTLAELLAADAVETTVAA